MAHIFGDQHLNRDLDDIIKVAQKNNETQFEVFPTDQDIAAGTIDSYTGLAYAVDVPASMTIVVILGTLPAQTKSKSDIIIDWGDGETLDIAKADVKGAVEMAKESPNGLISYVAGSNNGIYACHTYPASKAN